MHFIHHTCFVHFSTKPLVCFFSGDEAWKSPLEYQLGVSGRSIFGAGLPPGFSLTECPTSLPACFIAIFFGISRSKNTFRKAIKNHYRSFDHLGMTSKNDCTRRMWIYSAISLFSLWKDQFLWIFFWEGLLSRHCHRSRGQLCLDYYLCFWCLEWLKLSYGQPTHSFGRHRGRQLPDFLGAVIFFGRQS